MASVNINRIKGTAVCSEHGSDPCDHMDRLARRFGLWAYHAERRAEREGPAFPEFRVMANGMAETFRTEREILARVLERPIADRPDESPLTR